MDEFYFRDIHEFSLELSELVVRCDLDKPDVAAALVSAAVIIAESAGCDPDEQRESIDMLAENAIARLNRLNEPDKTRH